ncbi:MAG: hypothetical protein ACYC8T_18895 [Myxococcaceae bacterium]
MDDSAKTPEVMPAAELQQLWFTCLRKPWSSLLVMPAYPGGSAQAVARALVEVGSLHRSRPVTLLDAEGLTVAGATRAIEDLTRQASTGELTVLCAASVLSNQAVLPLAMAVDAVLLTVDLGTTDVSSARRTVELIGEKRFIGAVAIHPPRGPGK